jgi:hypothetical protein
MKKIGVSLLASLSAILPMVALAADDFGEINKFVDKIASFINDTLIPLLFGVALLVFLWGIFKYFILGGGDEGKREEGKQLMLWAIIGFVVMVSIFGIVNMIAGGLNLSEQQEIQNIPNVPQNNT